MARYEHLPVFNDTYNLNLYFFKLSRGFPKDYKYGLSQEVCALLTELLDAIIIANNSPDKQTVLQRASLVLERIKFKIRILKDLKVMNVRSYEYFSKQLVAVAQQISKWHGWSRDSQPA